jgi:gliding motility-associated-like protein
MGTRRINYIAAQCILVIFAAAGWRCYGQNLVPNGSFEQALSCPTAPGQINHLARWYIPTPGTSDFMHSCAPFSTTVSVPDNAFGSQFPLSGDGYAGFFVIANNTDYREYLQVKLDTNLRAGNRYYFEMYVSLADHSGFSSNKVGAYLSASPISSGIDTNLIYTPQFVSSNFITDMVGWTKVSGFFIAAGDERYLTIGASFLSSTGATSLATTGVNYNLTFLTSSYYYVDDVKLFDSCNLLQKVFLGVDTNMCGRTSVVLNAYQQHATSYEWSTGSPNPAIGVTQPGTYWVKVMSSGCTVQDTIHMVNTVLNLSLGNDTTVCSASTLTLKPAHSPGVSFLWNNNSTDSQITAAATGRYRVTISKDGCYKSDSILVNYVIVPDILGSDITLCDNGPMFPVFVTAQGANANTYEWSNSAITPYVLINDTGLYWVQVTKSSCVVRDSIHVKVVNMPPITLVKDTSMCLGTVLPLSLPAGADSYSWRMSGNITTPNFLPFSSAQSVLLYGSGMVAASYVKSGCKAYDTVVARFYVPPVFTGTPDTVICPGTSLPLIVHTAPSVSYPQRWQNGDTTPSVTVNTSGTYWVDVGHAGCILRDTINVLDARPIHVSLGNDTSLCNTPSLYLSRPYPNCTYRWSNGSSNPWNIIGLTGTYWLEVTDSTGCKERDTIHVSLSTTPLFSLGRDTTICYGKPLRLADSHHYTSYEWSTGSRDSAISITSAGTYWLEANNQGCPGRDSINVQVHRIPVNLGSDTTVCTKNSWMLNAAVPANATYLWSTGSSAPFIHAFSSGLYWVKVAESTCDITDSIQLTMNILGVNLGNDTAVCSNATLTLDAGINGAYYTWNDLSTHRTISVSSPGTFSVRVTKNGCTVADTVNVAMQAAPHVDLGRDTMLCLGDGLTLNAGVVGATYTWQDLSTTPFYFVTSPGSYKVLVRKGVCTVTDSIHVSYFDPKSLTLGNDTSYCFQEPALLHASVQADSYMWQDASQFSLLQVSRPGLYWLEVHKGGCVARDSILLSQQALPTVNLGSDKKICQHEWVTLDAGAGGSHYLWNDLSTKQADSATAPGLYFVTVTNAQGCYATDSITLDTFNAVHSLLSRDTFVCEAGQTTLDAGPGFLSYKWQDGSSNRYFTVVKAGRFYVQVKDQDQCSGSDTATVTRHARPVVSLPPVIKACNPDIVLKPQAGFSAYTWQDGSDYPVYEVTDYGTYSVTVIDSNQCTNTATTEVVNACPAILFVPTAFTPNNDQLNDVFVPLISNAKLYSIVIFNRWGDLVYSGTDPQKGWDGRYNGEASPSEIYFYAISYTGFDEVSATQRGNFLLLR